MIYVFGNYQLDTQTYELHCGNTLCKLEPRVFAVLMYLVENRDHIVTRDELVDNLWPGQAISEAVLNNCIMTARKALGDSGEGQQTIRTHYAQGYRFVAEVTEQLPDRGLNEAAMSANTPLFTDSPSPGATAPSSPSMPMSGGSSTLQNVLAGDYGFVTVLCGALEHTAALPEGVGGEATQHLRRTFFALAQEEAEQHGGTFRYFGADGILMVFGLPVAQEDHAQRAVLAGLKLQERLHESCLALDTPAAAAVTARIGLHAGPIELRCMTDYLESSSLTRADITTLAIRLHYLAKTGKLLTSKTTIPFVQEIVEMVEHGAVRMPGHAEPMMTYRICGLAA
jgi:DNA-binding winged helix-turn-helix (wHTH) protein/class 3 adenylate cyclase